jgi:hypothetical protein
MDQTGNAPHYLHRLHRSLQLNTFHISQFWGIKCKVISVLNSASGHENVWEREPYIPNFRTRCRWVVSFMPSHQSQSEDCKFVLPGMVHPSGYRNRGTNVNLNQVTTSIQRKIHRQFTKTLLSYHPHPAGLRPNILGIRSVSIQVWYGEDQPKS